MTHLLSPLHSADPAQGPLSAKKAAQREVADILGNNCEWALTLPGGPGCIDVNASSAHNTPRLEPAAILLFDVSLLRLRTAVLFSQVMACILAPNNNKFSILGTEIIEAARLGWCNAG